MVNGEIFARNARRYPEKEGWIYKDTRLTEIGSLGHGSRF